jgi:hypothetical protein
MNFPYSYAGLDYEKGSKAEAKDVIGDEGNREITYKKKENIGLTILNHDGPSVA